MAYIYYHKQIRNDDHCPLCKRYYITLHKTYEDVCKNAIACVVPDADDVEKLKRGDNVWIDEWIRRRNGDNHQIFKINPNYVYYLNEHSDGRINDIEQCDINYILLNIEIDKSKWCPDNIIFSISCHRSLNDVAKRVKELNLAKDDRRNIFNMKEVLVKYVDGSSNYYQLIKPEFGKEIYLNGLCRHVQTDVW
jgi:hypothetical protein